MTDLDIYQPAAGIGQHQAGIIMTEEQAKALDEQVRACTRAVLQEGTDYGIIPGTNGEQSSGGPARRSSCSGSTSNASANASTSNATTTAASTASPTAPKSAGASRRRPP